jgi:mono/diheme cytochrome c family protein
MKARHLTASGLSLLISVATLFCLSACRSPRRGEAVGRSVTKLTPSVERGHVIYQQHCYRCHPGGEGGLAPSLNDKPAPAFLIKTQVRAGLGAMPGFDKEEIPPADLDDLTAYMLALRRAPSRR